AILGTSGALLFPYTTLFRSQSDGSTVSTLYLGKGYEVRKSATRELRSVYLVGNGQLVASVTTEMSSADGSASAYPSNSTHFNDKDRKSTRLNSSHSQISYAV